MGKSSKSGIVAVHTSRPLAATVALPTQSLRGSSHRLAVQDTVHASRIRPAAARRYTLRMSAHRPITRLRVRTLLLGTALALGCGLAQAQWQWVDETGRKVFSDTPPPAGVPDKSILRRPHERAAPPAVVEREAETAQAPAPAAPRRDDQLEARKKQAEEAEKAKQQAEMARIALIRQENCQRATRARATLASGVRASTTNARGEIEIMDDKARAAEVQRLERIMAQDCGPMPPAQ